jgi:hypothetical protein
MEWIMEVLKSEFFWGVVVGVVLTTIGAWCQVILAIRQQRKAQKNLIKNFCIDTVGNIKAIVDDMVNHRQIDPPPLKWSDLRYVFDIKEDCNGKEAIQA